MLNTTVKTDFELQHDVLAALGFDPRVNATHIGVTARDGVVTLSGKVPTYAERYQAGRIVLGVQGVKALADEIEVDLPVLHRRDDEAIARALADALAESVLVPHDRVKVKVHGGTVTLSGETQWHYQKRAAEQVARLTSGVKGIVNLITVKAHPGANWAAVRRQIESAFQRHASLDARKVQVEVDGGKVTLRGTVRSWAERHDAELAAWSAPGVHELENLIEVQYTG